MLAFFPGKVHCCICNEIIIAMTALPPSPAKTDSICTGSATGTASQPDYTGLLQLATKELDTLAI